MTLCWFVWKLGDLNIIILIILIGNDADLTDMSNEKNIASAFSPQPLTNIKNIYILCLCYALI